MLLTYRTGESAAQLSQFGDKSNRFGVIAIGLSMVSEECVWVGAIHSCAWHRHAGQESVCIESKATTWSHEHILQLFLHVMWCLAHLYTATFDPSTWGSLFSFSCLFFNYRTFPCKDMDNESKTQNERQWEAEHNHWMGGRCCRTLHAQAEVVEWLAPTRGLGFMGAPRSIIYHSVSWLHRIHTYWPVGGMGAMARRTTAKWSARVTGRSTDQVCNLACDIMVRMLRSWETSESFTSCMLKE